MCGVLGMCNSDNGKCKCLDVKRVLLAKVEWLEGASKRGLTLRDLNTDIPAEKIISPEHCKWTLKNCKTFRHFIEESFNEDKYQKIIDLLNNGDSRDIANAAAQKIANMHADLEVRQGNKTHILNVELLEIAGHLLNEMEKQFQLKSIGPAARYKLAVLKALECIVSLK